MQVASVLSNTLRTWRRVNFAWGIFFADSSSTVQRLLTTADQSVCCNRQSSLSIQTAHHPSFTTPTICTRLRLRLSIPHFLAGQKRTHTTYQGNTTSHHDHDHHMYCGGLQQRPPRRWIFLRLFELRTYWQARRRLLSGVSDPFCGILCSSSSRIFIYERTGDPT